MYFRTSSLFLFVLSAAPLQGALATSVTEGTKDTGLAARDYHENYGSKPSYEDEYPKDRPYDYEPKYPTEQNYDPYPEYGYKEYPKYDKPKYGYEDGYKSHDGTYAPENKDYHSKPDYKDDYLYNPKPKDYGHDSYAPDYEDHYDYGYDLEDYYEPEEPGYPEYPEYPKYPEDPEYAPQYPPAVEEKDSAGAKMRRQLPYGYYDTLTGSITAAGHSTIDRTVTSTTTVHTTVERTHTSSVPAYSTNPSLPTSLASSSAFTSNYPNSTIATPITTTETVTYTSLSTAKTLTRTFTTTPSAITPPPAEGSAKSNRVSIMGLSLGLGISLLLAELKMF